MIDSDAEEVDRPAPPQADAAAMPLNNELPPESAALIAKGLFRPTVKRMTILITTLVDATAAGDFALWAPLAAMEQVMLDLKWDVAAPQQTQKFLAVAAGALRLQADRFADYSRRLGAWQTGEPFPTLTEWSQADTLRVYDQVEAAFASTPPAPGGPGTADTPPHEQCPECGGKGEVDESRDASPTEANGGMSVETRTVQCARCAGTGTVPSHG